MKQCLLERRGTVRLSILLMAGLVIYGAPGLIASSQAPATSKAPAAEAAHTAGKGTQALSASIAPSSITSSMPRRQENYYRVLWGVDSLNVRAAESGEIIRFKWTVLDASKAKILNDEKVEPFLIDPIGGVKLVVPELPFMGKMRVKNTPQAGMTYWMGFSNPGKVVKPGDHVNVVIGQFHADGLVVQ